jgi:F420H(2)-dependent quinone reductase
MSAMKIAKWLAIAVGVYLVLVVAFECFVTFMGKRQADHGVRPDEDWVVITTTDASGPQDTVIAGVEVDGHLYVSANHWPRSWYRRATAHPEVEVTHAGHRGPYKAVPVSGEELVRVAARYHLPWMVRFLSGFPPRSYLRLDSR